MDFSGFAVQGLNGLAGASSLFLVAAGLSLIFGVTRIVNFAHGSFFMLGIYLAYSLVEHVGRAVGLSVSFWWLLLLAGSGLAAAPRGRHHSYPWHHLGRSPAERAGLH